MADRPPITTHVLDLVNGKPAEGIQVRLFNDAGLLAHGVTDRDGRVTQWSGEITVAVGKYRLEFDVEPELLHQVEVVNRRHVGVAGRAAARLAVPFDQLD